MVSKRGRDKLEKVRRALFRRNWTRAEMLLEIPADRKLPNIHVDQEQWSVLHVAAMVAAPIDLVQRLMQVTDVDFCLRKDSNGNTPLHKTTCVETMRLFALACPQKFYQENHEGMSPVDLLMTFRQEHEVAHVIAQVAAAWPEGVHSVNSRQENLLHRAIPHSVGEFDMLGAILDAAPDLLEKQDMDGAAPIHHAARRKDKDAATRLDYLLQHCHDRIALLESTDFFGQTPLHGACGSVVKRDVIEVLVANCPDALKMQDNVGLTPLAMFSRHYRDAKKQRSSKREEGIAEAAMTLLTGKPTRCSDNPSLHSLLRICTLDIARFLVSALPEQASVPDAHGNLPLHVISSMSVVDNIIFLDVISRLLLIYPDACHVVNNQGMLPLQLMARSGKTWKTAMKLVFVHHPAAVMDVGINSSFAVSTLLEKTGKESPDALFRLLANAPDLVKRSNHR